MHTTDRTNAELAWIGSGVRIVHPEHGHGIVQSMYWTSATVYFDAVTRYGVRTLEVRLIDVRPQSITDTPEYRAMDKAQMLIEDADRYTEDP